MNFYSNGKLLLTGEYLVLDGAKALAIPTKYGQSLEVSSREKKGMHWTSIAHDGSIWFENELNIENLATSYMSEDNLVTRRIFDLLICAKQLNPEFLSENIGLQIKTSLDFNRNWGLGTSSTLINNVAQWANVDAYTLLENTFGGSGYDIACAKHNAPIVFQRVNNKPHSEEVAYNPLFSEQLYFVYLNKKERSDAAVKRYKDISLEKRIAYLKPISQITESILHCESFDLFNELISEHEQLIGDLINELPVKQKLFGDFDGAIKSLGAWGGDFILVSSNENPRDYFESKGYSVVIPFNEMIKK